MSDRDELIAKARELSAAASPGPWGIAGGYIKGADTYPVCEPWPPIDRNGRFIAESRTLLPALADLAESEGRRADEAEARQGWRPIETAPKNGTFILAYWSEETHPHEFVCRYDIVQWLPTGTDTGDWFDVSEDDVIDPTNWMPLPCAPREQP